MKPQASLVPDGQEEVSRFPDSQYFINYQPAFPETPLWRLASVLSSQVTPAAEHLRQRATQTRTLLAPIFS
jgi:hypothetical protein